MTASTLSRLPMQAGSALAAGLGRAGHWTLARYMRAPLASTGLLAMVTLTAMAASNALYNQPFRHPAPFFAPASDVPQPVMQTSDAPAIAPIPAVASPQVQQVQATTPPETTGSLAAPQVIPDAPVGNKDAYAVQKKLAELGLFEGTVDGFYGPMTARAIRSFEERNGLVPTGALTPGVIDAILRSDANGRMPVAVAAPQPVVQPAPVVVPAPQPVAVAQAVQPAPVPEPVQVVQPALLPAIAPASQPLQAVETTAASTIDTIVAAVGGTQRTTPSSALPMMPTQQPMPAPVQVASLEPMAPPRVMVVDEAPAQPTEQAAIEAEPVDPANNVQLVSQIQRGLASLGFYHGSIDGHPGDATAKAIREFENFHSFKVTGQVNPDLVELLQSAGASI